MYLHKVLDRLRLNNGVDIVFTYSTDDVYNSIPFINWCERNELSPYKCLTFLCDYMNGGYDITKDINGI